MSSLILAVPPEHFTQEEFGAKLHLPNGKTQTVYGYNGNGRLDWSTRDFTPPPWLKNISGRVIGARIEETIKHPYQLRVIEAGEYEFRGAKAEVTFDIESHTPMHVGDRSFILPLCRIKITARSAKTALELRRQILGGKIKPKISWGKHDLVQDRDLYSYMISGTIGHETEER